VHPNKQPRPRYCACEQGRAEAARTHREDLVGVGLPRVGDKAKRPGECNEVGDAAPAPGEGDSEEGEH
jgi:hypothetical protein